MSSTVISVENVSKQYRLGEVGTGSIAHDVNRWWHKIRGKEDPYLMVGETNDRTVKGNSEYAWALRDVSFDVKQGEIIGIVGKNGAGKSTLLKILSRVTQPTTGSVKVKGRIASLLEVGTGFHPELTGKENIYLNGSILGMRKDEISRKLEEIIDFSGCERYIDTPVKRYSSGMYVRLAFAVAAHLEPEILIVDEVLAVGDMEFQNKCIGKMKDVSNNGRTILFVSHNINAIRKLCEKGVLMRNGKVDFVGEIDDVLKSYGEISIPSNEIEFVANPAKPSITRISVMNRNVMDQISIKIDFESPFPIKNIMPGIVVSSPSGEPIFGSNTRYHPSNTDNFEVARGSAILAVDTPPLYSGKYFISAWLGNWESNYDEKINALLVELVGDDPHAQMPHGDRIGFTKINAEWRLTGA